MNILFQITIIFLLALTAALVTLLVVRFLTASLHNIIQDRPNKEPTRIFWPSLSGRPVHFWDQLIGWSGLTRHETSLRHAGIFVIVLLLGSLFLSRMMFFLLLTLFVTSIAVLVWKASSNKRRCAEQLPDAIDALAQSLRAGYAVPEAIALIERESNEPIRLLFGSLARAHAFRLSLNEAGRLISNQIRLPDWDLFIYSLRIQGETGGNLIPVLSHIAASLRDKQKVQQEVRSATAAGKFSGLLIASLAPISFFAFYFFIPEYISVMRETPMGIFLLIIAASLEGIGFFIIWRIVTVPY